MSALVPLSSVPLAIVQHWHDKFRLGRKELEVLREYAHCDNLISAWTYMQLTGNYCGVVVCLSWVWTQLEKNSDTNSRLLAQEMRNYVQKL
jgi:hypothetical protein